MPGAILQAVMNEGKGRLSARFPSASWLAPDSPSTACKLGTAGSLHQPKMGNLSDPLQAKVLFVRASGQLTSVLLVSSPETVPRVPLLGVRILTFVMCLEQRI